MRISTLRFHAVIPDHLCTVEALNARGGAWKDLWGWVSITASAQAVLSSITTPESTFSLGHEAFFIVAPTIVQQRHTRELLAERYPYLVADWDRSGRKDNEGLFSTKKAERLLGWKETITNRMSN
jgi:hypothetical protein